MRKHIPFIIFYFFFLLTGLLVYSDYGVSWDEAECRIDNGILNTNFIRTHDEKPLLESISKYHGAAFEMLLVKVEQVCGLKSTHDIFLMRHLVTFFLFALSILFFYMLCLKAFRSQWYALAGCLMLVLSPRIFADSFYNSKDLPFLSFVIINFYLVVNFLGNKTIRNAILCAIFAGVMIDIRIMGLLIPVFTFMYLFIDFIRNKDQRKRIIQSSLVFILILISTIILLWPVLWLGPVKHFILAWKEFSKYPWEGSVLYRGVIYQAAELPWHYLPLWMIISTPPLYIALFVTGIFALAKKLFAEKSLTVIESFSLLLVILPLASVLLLNSVVYDGWRHMFFIYPAVVLIAVNGLQSVINLIHVINRKYFVALVAAYFVSVIITMAELHPFENIYFNSFIKPSKVNGNYEADYWGLSYKQAFEYILANDSSHDLIVCLGEEQPGTDNMLFLPQRSRDRITITDQPELTDYYLTCHRYDRQLKRNGKVHQISRDGIIIHSVYDMRYNKIVLNDSERIANYKNDYEHVPEQFHPPVVKADRENNHSEYVTPDAEYAGNFTIHPPESLLKNSTGKKYMIASFKLLSAEPFRTMVVLQVDSTVTYQWMYNVINNSNTNEWNSYKYICTVPEINSSTDVLKVYFQNYENGEFRIDDFSVQFFAVDTSIVNGVRKKQPL